MGRKMMLEMGPEVELKHKEEELIYFSFNSRMPYEQIVQYINNDLRDRYGFEPEIKIVEFTQSRGMANICYKVEGRANEGLL